MRRYLLVWLLLAAVRCATLVHQHQPEGFTFSHYNKGAKVLDSVKSHEFTFAIKENNIDKLESLLAKVSDPQNTEYYGNYMSKTEIEKMTFNKEGFDAVKKFSLEHNFEILGEYKNLIKARAPLKKLVEVFNTEFYSYHKAKNNKNKRDKNQITRCLSYVMPAALEGHVAHIYSLTDIPPPIYGGEPPSSKLDNFTISSANSRKLGGITYGVTPQVLYDFYGITGSVSQGNQSIFASLGQTYSEEDLSLFQSYFGLSDNPIVRNVNRKPQSLSYCNTNIDDCAESSLDVQYITAAGIDGPTTHWYQSDDSATYMYTDNIFLEWAYNVSYTDFPPLVHSISYGSYEILLDDAVLDLFSAEMIKLGLRGITVIAASGDDGVAGYLFRSAYGLKMSQCYMYASFPASNPYVTAVGGTSGPENQDSSTTEIACSVKTGQTITTGGGFSNYYSLPSWQSAAVNTYVNNNKAKASPYSAYRGYPDISMAGESYVVAIGGYLYYVSGTSASAPVYAGLVSLVNSYRLSQGWSAVGFMNSAIYSNNGAFANDVLSGDNYCTSESNRCCTSVGFTCGSSWDPVTGFGTINYGSFLSYFSSEIPSTANTPTNKPTKMPTSAPTKKPSDRPTRAPSALPTAKPTIVPTVKPSFKPTIVPTRVPTRAPSVRPTAIPTNVPSAKPSYRPTIVPTMAPSSLPTTKSTNAPSLLPTAKPSYIPTLKPSPRPPTFKPSQRPPTFKPSIAPTKKVNL